MTVLTRFVRSALLLLVFVAGGVVAQDAAQESKRDVMRRLVNEVYTGESFQVLSTAFSSEFTWLGAGGRPVSLADWQTDVEALGAAMPDLHARTIHLMSSGGWVASLAELNGTFDEPLTWRGQTVTPNGGEVAWQQFDIVYFGDDGQAVYGHSERDMRGLLTQLGASQGGAQPIQPVQAASAASAGQAAQAAPAISAASFTREDEDRFAQTLDGFLESALANPDATVFDPFFSDDFQLHWPAGDGTLDDLAQWLIDLNTALPEATLETPALFVDEDYAAVRLHLRGVFLGQWTDDAGTLAPPNGLELTLTANLLFRFNADAEIAELWLVYDRADWATQFTSAEPVAS